MVDLKKRINKRYPGEHVGRLQLWATECDFYPSRFRLPQNPYGEP